MPAVQRREDVPEVVPTRSPDPAQGCADRARLTEHGQLLVRQLPERPAARALHGGGGHWTDLVEGVADRRPAGAVEPAVQQLADQHVLVPRWPHGAGVEPGPAERGHLHPPTTRGVRRPEAQRAASTRVPPQRGQGDAEGQGIRSSAGQEQDRPVVLRPGAGHSVHPAGISANSAARTQKWVIRKHAALHPHALLP